jgi:dTDP-4-amino-4,6-dideoxygalactose transaminase
MPVHLGGRPVDLERVASVADRHDLLVIEDAAHAIGAEWQRRRIGSHGNLAAFSFYVTKNITTVEGGALATNDPAVAEDVERLALHGLSAGAWQRYSDAGFKHYEVVEPGYKFNLTDMQAALGIHQLPQLDGWIDRRAELWQRYDDLLSDLPLILPPPPSAEMRHARHLYQVRVTPDAGVGRDEVLEGLRRQRIGSGVHYRGVHLHPYFRDRYAIVPESLPVATAISDTTLSLPLAPDLDDTDQNDVVAALEHTFARQGARALA